MHPTAVYLESVALVAAWSCLPQAVARPEMVVLVGAAPDLSAVPVESVASQRREACQEQVARPRQLRGWPIQHRWRCHRLRGRLSRCAGLRKGRSRQPSRHGRRTVPERPSSGGGIPPRCVFDGGPSDSGKCRQDSDCTAGINGRCFEHGDCYMMCSYDECFQDSDCAGNVPCSCRDSASSAANNWCLVDSNCHVDDDCGPSGLSLTKVAAV
jgi:hypothetical protein